MERKMDHLKDIQEIRSMMERSSKFISLSGLSGVFAGTFAIVGAVMAYLIMGRHYNLAGTDSYAQLIADNTEQKTQLFTYFVIDAISVLIASVSFGFIFTIRNSKKKGLPIWDHTAKRLLINLLVPLVTGGLFALALLVHGIVGFIAPVTLLFYGLALFNASKYTFEDIRFLGISEIVLGIISCFFIGFGLIFWTIGFGLMHIVYGVVMYNKYEK